MADESLIVFNCATCGEQIEAPADFAGQEAECPGCGAIISVPPQSKAPIAAPIAPKSDDKKGSTIKIDLPVNEELYQAPAKRNISIKRRS